jgi:hypothetical protein
MSWIFLDFVVGSSYPFFKKVVNDQFKKALDTGYHFSVRKATHDVPNVTRNSFAIS